jgi:knotted carbamoyltransferase YgeW
MTQDLRTRIGRLDEATLRGLYDKSMLLTREWSKAQLDALCGLAETFEALDRARVATPLFENQIFAALFLDASTRTRSSWTGAAARLGAGSAVFDGATTQISHGETAEETGTMLGMNSHALGIRHDLILGEGNKFMREARAGIESYLRRNGDDRALPVVNLQCDVDHPTQALADLGWLRERFGERLEGKTITVSWAYSPSYAKPLSVPQGLIMLLPRFGMHVRLAHPQGYDLMPDCLKWAEQAAVEGGGSFRRFASMDDAFDGADVVYPKSWGPYDLMLERVGANRDRDAARMKEIEGRALARNKEHTDWICDERRMAKTAGGDALYMHCLPADIGAEVSPGVMERHRFHVAREANKKVYMVMALLAAAKERNLAARLAKFVG